MNIESGARVRSIDKQFPEFVGEKGTYLGRQLRFYKIKWDNSGDLWYDLHLEDEFEVIDE